MVGSVYNIAVSGLNTAQAGMAAISNNISNSSTKGYSRQDIVQVASPGILTNVGFLGTGSEVSDVRRSSNDFLAQRINEATSEESFFQSYKNPISQIDGVLSDDANGVTAGFTGFFTAIQDLTLRPGDSSSRESVLTAAKTVAARLNGVSTAMSRVRDGINESLQAGVSMVNSITDQIADLNIQITNAINRAGGGTPNELLDRRDNLLNDLSKYVQNTVVKNSDSTIDVYMSNGQTLVSKAKAINLEVINDEFNPSTINVGLRFAEGTESEKVIRFDQKALGAGQLGGLISMRDTDLSRYENIVGVIASQFASKVNDIQSQGYDLSGGFGKPMYAVEASTAASASSNNGEAQITLTSVNFDKSTARDFEIVNDGGVFRYRAANTRDEFVAVTEKVSGSSVSYAIGDELEFSVSSGSVSGDRYLILPSRNGASTIRVVMDGAADIAAAISPNAKGDGRNLQKMADLQKVTVENTAFGTTQKVTITEAFNQLISKIGNRTREVDDALITRTSVRQGLEAQLQDTAGVNLDEEAAKLLNYQQAYQASGRIVAMSKDLFDSLIAALR